MNRILILLLFVSLISCRPDRSICSYAVRNKLVERSPRSIDSVRVNEVYRKYDKKDGTYLEIANYSFKGVKQIIIGSDFYRGGRNKFFDKYEKVNHYVLDSTDVVEIIKFYNEIKKPIKTNDKGGVIEYSIDKETFFTFHLIYYYAFNSPGFRNPSIESMSVWMKGRKHDVSHIKFFKALQK